MDTNNKSRADTKLSFNCPDDGLFCDTPEGCAYKGKNQFDQADDLRKEWRETGTGPYAQPAAPVVDAAELSKLKALAEAATQRSDDITLLRAAAKDLFNKSFADPEVTISSAVESKRDAVVAAITVFQEVLKATADTPTATPLIALVAQQAARIEELERLAEPFEWMCDLMLSVEYNGYNITAIGYDGDRAVRVTEVARSGDFTTTTTKAILKAARLVEGK